MSLVIGEQVTHEFGATQVLKDVSFRLTTGARVGLVGPNGEGKTTLLRLIGGWLEPTIGQVHRMKGLRIGYLPQEPPALSGTTIHDAMLGVFADVIEMEREMEEFSARMAASPDDRALIDRYGDLQHRFEARGGYGYSTRIEQVLAGLSFPRETWDRPLSNLSGGQRTRAYLATLLLSDPDLLMLDEPTNHLDMDSVEWLEGWLSNFNRALIVVSHDRYFLDRVTSATWEVSHGGVEMYRGAYSRYVEQRAERDKERLRRWKIQQEYIERTQEFIRIHLAGQRSREAQGRRTRLERFIKEEAIDRPSSSDVINLNLKAAARTGDVVIRAEDLEAGYDATRPLVYARSIEVFRGDRIAVVGANGAGKTTLIRTLLGELPSLSGTVKLGANVEIGYLSQHHANLDGEATVLDTLLDVAPTGFTAEEARSLLGSLLLTGTDVFKRVCDLSGGQRSRVVLAQLAVQNSNVLFLDEPTNHLDIPSTEIVQEVLGRFDGTLIFVSHDRYLVEAVATQVWAIDSGVLHVVSGGWQGYLDWRAERQAEAAGPDASSKAAKEARKAEYERARREASEQKRLKRRHEEIEARITVVEREIKELESAISAAGESRNVATVERLGRDYESRQSELASLWAEWESLSERLE